jgi:hypothetical protein
MRIAFLVALVALVGVAHAAEDKFFHHKKNKTAIWDAVQDKIDAYKKEKADFVDYISNKLNGEKDLLADADAEEKFFGHLHKNKTHTGSFGDKFEDLMNHYDDKLDSLKNKLMGKEKFFLHKKNKTAAWNKVKKGIEKIKQEKEDFFSYIADKLNGEKDLLADADAEEKFFGHLHKNKTNHLLGDKFGDLVNYYDNKMDKLKNVLWGKKGEKTLFLSHFLKKNHTKLYNGRRALLEDADEDEKFFFHKKNHTKLFGHEKEKFFFHKKNHTKLYKGRRALLEDADEERFFLHKMNKTGAFKHDEEKYFFHKNKTHEKNKTHSVFDKDWLSECFLDKGCPDIRPVCKWGKFRNVCVQCLFDKDCPAGVKCNADNECAVPV